MLADTTVGAVSATGLCAEQGRNAGTSRSCLCFRTGLRAGKCEMLAKTTVACASARRLRSGKCEMLAEVTVAGALTTRLRAGQGEMLAEATVAGVSATGLRARQGRNAG